MTKSRQPGGKSPVRGALSRGLIALGVALSLWALVSIAGQSPSVAVPVKSVPEISRLSTESIAASDTSAAVDTSATADTADNAARVNPVKPDEGEYLGVLRIPALGQAFPIVQGTGTAELKKGVGHMVQTAMPGEPDNCVISGHRDTVFTDLGKLKKKDRLIIETAKGTFTYQIRRIRIVHKNDRTVVVPADHAVLTVSTCYPFRYVGSAPDRYVLIADLVATE